MGRRPPTQVFWRLTGVTAGKRPPQSARWVLRRRPRRGRASARRWRWRPAARGAHVRGPSPQPALCGTAAAGGSRPSRRAPPQRSKRHCYARAAAAAAGAWARQRRWIRPPWPHGRARPQSWPRSAAVARPTRRRRRERGARGARRCAAHRRARRRPPARPTRPKRRGTQAPRPPWQWAPRRAVGSSAAPPCARPSRRRRATAAAAPRPQDAA